MSGLHKRISRFLTIAFISIVIIACSGGGSSDGSSDDNFNAPVANAGPDQMIAVGSLTTLDGGLSRDANDNTFSLTYIWLIISKPGNSSAVLDNPTSVSPSFQADALGQYTFSLVVNDGKHDSQVDKVTITAATGVGGIISSNTTWYSIDSPYVITSDVQIAYGATLLIEEGVKVYGQEGEQVDIHYSDFGGIEVFGALEANGSANSRIQFEKVNIAPGNGPTNEWFTIHLDYIEATYGSVYAPTGSGGHGSISLTNSILSNLEYMYLWYPVENCFIEKNIFINSGGISVGTDSDVKVYIRNNTFYQYTGSSGEEYAVRNWASYDTSETILEYNSFLSTDRVAVALPDGYTSAKLTAANNFWNTTNTSVVDSMIYDKNDSLSSPGYISYLPILSSPDVGTPDITPYIQ